MIINKKERIFIIIFVAIRLQFSCIEMFLGFEI